MDGSEGKVFSSQFKWEVPLATLFIAFLVVGVVAVVAFEDAMGQARQQVAYLRWMVVL